MKNGRGGVVAVIGGVVLVVGATAPAAFAAEGEESAISGSLDLTASTHYIFRGLVQEDQGLVFQPSLTLGAELATWDGQLQSLGLSFNSWNSFHSGPTGSGGSGSHSPTSWYESDFTVGLSFGFACGATLDVSWLEYTSPNGSFSTTSEIDFALGYDDSAAWGEGSSFGGLAPTVTLAV